MTIKKILENFMKGELNYGNARAELKKIGLEYEDLEHYESILDGLRDAFEFERGNTTDPMDHQFRPLESVPTEIAHEILLEAISLIKQGNYPQEIGSVLYMKYGIGSMLCTYFYNEAFDLVRLYDISEETMQSIGEVYMSEKINQMITNGSMVLLKGPPGTEPKVGAREEPEGEDDGE